MLFEFRASHFTQVSSIEQEEEGRGHANHVSIIREYRAKIEAKLFEICARIVKLIGKKLVPAVGNGDSKVFYLKMKGDYHRYLAEFKTGNDRKAAVENTLTAYKSTQFYRRSLEWSNVQREKVLSYILSALCWCSSCSQRDAKFEGCG